MESLGSSIRSAARATFSAYRTVPIRWRLAGGSAALTFVILAAFAALVGVFTTNQLRGQFRDQVREAAEQLRGELEPMTLKPTGELGCTQQVSLSDYVSTEHAQIRIIDPTSGFVWCTQDQVRIKGAKRQAGVGPTFRLPTSPGMLEERGFLVDVTKRLAVKPEGSVWLLYARPLSDLDHTLARVRVFLLLGVLGGTVLALLAGLATAQRAIRPIAALTEAAREIERTRDPSRHVPLPKADDEVAELARTLEGMLESLDRARSGTEQMLDRQREFVADASHELRTPLTSVLASLELLAEELEGEQADTAQAALRSAQRMRRLVGDLLLLARADAKRVAPRRPTELDDVLKEVASELGPVAEQHEMQIDPEPVVVSGARDELHRMTLNLVENAVKHTPAGTHIRAATLRAGDEAVLIVEDDGPGILPALEQRLFERFVRGARDGGRGSGLGLAIVRAVAESHGGSVTLEQPDDSRAARSSEAGRRAGGKRENGSGARFVVRLPAIADPAISDDGEEPNYTSTTTGRTIGRRRSRS